LAILHQEQGELEEARGLYERAVALQRETGSRRDQGTTLYHFATLSQEQGRLDEALGFYQEALGIHREVGHPRVEGTALRSLADLERWRTGDLSAGEPLAARGEELLTTIGDKIELGKLLCTRGHLALAAGRDAAALLERVGALARESGAGPGSELGRRL